MIYHSIRASFKPGVTQAQKETILERLREQGRVIDAVQSWTVGKDVGGKFEVGAMYVFETLEAYKEYMLDPFHRQTDDLGLPLVANMVSFDLTDDPEPTIGDQIRDVHASRFGGDEELAALVQGLSSYSGSSVPTDGAPTATHK